MKLRVSLPTYGQVVEHLQRSSPGLQTRLNLARYLLQKDIMALDDCHKAILQNNAVLVYCQEEEEAKLRGALEKIVITAFSEALDMDIKSYYNGEPFIT